MSSARLKPGALVFNEVSSTDYTDLPNLWIGGSMNTLFQDLKYGSRMLLKHPLVTAIGLEFFNQLG